MNEQDVLAVLTNIGAVATNDHFVYASWKHGPAYVNFRLVYPYTRQVSILCRALAEEFAGDAIEVVVAPEKDGIILSQWVAYHLSEITGREVLSFFAEKADEGDFVIQRGDAQKKLPGKRVLVVDDVGTTGGSVKKVAEAVRALGGNVVGIGFLCNRGGVKPKDVGNPPKLVALANVSLDAWDEADCPLCKQGIPINEQVGHGKDYINSKKQKE